MLRLCRGDVLRFGWRNKMQQLLSRSVFTVCELSMRAVHTRLHHSSRYGCVRAVRKGYVCSSRWLTVDYESIIALPFFDLLKTQQKEDFHFGPSSRQPFDNRSNNREAAALQKRREQEKSRRRSVTCGWVWVRT